MRARRRALRRLRARRSSSLSPPQTPESWPVSRAQRRQSSTTGHRRHTALASSIWTNAGPVLPIGKNNSGSSSRQAASWRQSMRNHSICAGVLGSPVRVNAFTCWLPLRVKVRFTGLKGKKASPSKQGQGLGSQTFGFQTRDYCGFFRRIGQFDCALGHIWVIYTICPLFTQDINGSQCSWSTTKLGADDHAKAFAICLEGNWFQGVGPEFSLVVPGRVSVCR